MAEQNPVNSLRNLLTPADDVNFELNLNRHPRGYKNKSISHALNMKLSDDGTILENDPAFDINKIIYDSLNAHYKTNTYIIKYIIPTNTELVLFIKRPNVNIIDIWRYREKSDNYDENFALFYTKGLPYHNGKFSGTFTYNSFDCLIIAFCEYDGDEDCPLSTINLGNFTKGEKYRNTYIWKSAAEGFDDRNLDYYKLPISPEVKLPNINGIQTGNNELYVGWYYCYIRYKINKYDYTQWYNFGIPIINNLLTDTVLYQRDGINDKDKCDKEASSKYGTATVPLSKSHDLPNAIQTDRRYKYVGRFSSSFDLVQHSLKILLNNIDNRYESFQLGFRCVSKTYNKYFRTEDLNNITEFDLCLNNLIEENFNVQQYSNYYNVKTIINKRNRIYIANYKEFNSKYEASIQNSVDNINVELVDANILNTDWIDDFKNLFKFDFTYEDFVQNEIYKYAILNAPAGDWIYAADDYRLNWTSNYRSLLYFLLFIENEANVDIFSHISKKIKIHCKKVNPDNPGEAINTTYNINDITKLRIGYIPSTKLIVDQELAEQIYQSPGTDFRNKPEYNTKLNDCPEIDYYCLRGTSELGADTLSPKVMLHKGDSSFGYYIEAKDAFTIEFEDHTIIDFSRYIQYGSLFNNISAIDYLVKLNYNNPTNSYNTNYADSLIPGEIYDFYIHFVDKYNNYTEGYRLKNNSPKFKYYIHDKLTDYSIIKINTANGEKLLAFPSDNKILKTIETNIDWFNVEDVLEVDSITSLQQGNYYRIKPKEPLYTENQARSLLGKSLQSLRDINDHNITWGQLLDYSDNRNIFLHFVNSEGHDLFKVPVFNNMTSTKGLKLSNVTIPEGYVGYFVSAAKHEKTIKLSGIGGDYFNAKILFNDLINIEKLEYGAHIMKFTKYNNDITNNLQFTKYINKYDKENVLTSYLTIGTSTTAFAADGQTKRGNKGSAILFNGVLGINAKEPEYNELGICELLYINPNIYSSKNKELYRIGNIQYTLNEFTINNGLNGRFNRNSIIKLGDSIEGVEEVYCSYVGQDKPDNSTHLYGNVYYTELYQFDLGDSETLYVNKTGHFYNKSGESHVNAVTYDYLYSEVWYNPIDLLDLFGVKLYNQFEGILEKYSAVSDKKDYLSEFNRTVYRSNVISDESKQNNWRFFEADAYKNIEENKGNITNLVSIGHYLYVHTIHSLFAFNDDNSLEMNNQQLQVSTPDIFDTQYKEQFNTILGFGGLQDKDSWIAGSFGYIYYNKDDKQIIRIGSDSLEIISNAIYEYLDIFNPDKILFANDVENDRIIIKLSKGNDNVYLSYNYKYKRFVSTHKTNMQYEFAYNTKDKLYLLRGTNINTTINSIYYLENKNKFGSFRNYNIKPNPAYSEINYNYSVSFMINRQYNTIKYLEYIKYKLRKRERNTEKVSINIVNFPVEQCLIPYSGEKLRIFNDLCDSNQMDISTNKETMNRVTDYNKPYYHLGNWHFNLIRDVLNGNDKDTMARIYGNYFIIEFDFGSCIEHLEFENLDVALTEDNNR